MSVIEAREVAEEQIEFWAKSGITPEVALRGLRSWPRRDTWAEVRAYMIRWWLRNHDAA